MWRRPGPGAAFTYHLWSISPNVPLNGGLPNFVQVFIGQSLFLFQYFGFKVGGRQRKCGNIRNQSQLLLTVISPIMFHEIVVLTSLHKPFASKFQGVVWPSLNPAGLEIFI